MFTLVFWWVSMHNGANSPRFACVNGLMFPLAGVVCAILSMLILNKEEACNVSSLRPGILEGLYFRFLPNDAFVVLATDPIF